MSIPSSRFTKAFERFKKSRFNMPVAFVMVFLLDIALLWISIYSSTDACMARILMSLITLFGFVWLGVNDPKKLMILATAIFLAIVPIHAVMYADALCSLEYPDHMDPDKYVMSEVNVEPYLGNGEMRYFNFTAVVPGNAENVSIELKVMDGTYAGKIYYDENMTRYNGTNETVFYSNVELGPGTYVFSVYAYENGKIVNDTGLYYFYGPQNLERNDFIITVLPYSLIKIFLEIGGLTYILVGMYWWTRIASRKRKEALTVTKEEGEMIKCPVCEHRIPYGTRTCPYCNAELEYDEEQEGKGEKESVEDKIEEKDGTRSTVGHEGEEEAKEES